MKSMPNGMMCSTNNGSLLLMLNFLVFYSTWTITNDKRKQNRKKNLRKKKEKCSFKVKKKIFSNFFFLVCTSIVRFWFASLSDDSGFCMNESLWYLYIWFVCYRSLSITKFSRAFKKDIIRNEYKWIKSSRWNFRQTAKIKINNNSNKKNKEKKKVWWRCFFFSQHFILLWKRRFNVIL